MKRFYSLFFGLAVFLAAGSFGLGAGARNISVSASETSDSASAEAFFQSLAAAPTIVCEINAQEDLEQLKSGNALLQNAVWTVDGNMTVLNAQGESLGAFETLRAEISGDVIDNFYISSEAVISGLKAYAEKNGDYDFSMIASDPELLREAKDAIPQTRGMIDFSEDLPEKKTALAESNEAGANVIILSAEQADEETVSYFQQRMKTVWAIAEEGRFGVLKACASGAFGIILKDAAVLEEAFPEVGDTTVLTRNPLNVAHRGDPLIYNENSLDGCEAAYQNGASHIELDFRLTKDGEIVVMHDAILNTTTDGSGAINQMTLEQIRNYHIIKRIDGVESGTKSVIPTIDEVFEFIGNKDICLLFEIKSSEEALVEKLSEKLEQYGVADKVVVISFDRTQLQRVREKIPHIGALDLNTAYETSVENLCASETGYDIDKSAYSSEFVSYMINRGFMPCFWTYNDFSDYLVASEEGIFGLTNNCASRAGAIGYDICIESPEMKKTAIKEGLELSYSVIKTNGKLANSDGKAIVIAYKDCGTYAECIVKAATNIPVERVKTVKISYEAEAAGGCGSVCLSSGLPLFSAVVFVVAMFLIKKRAPAKA